MGFTSGHGLQTGTGVKTNSEGCTQEERPPDNGGNEQAQGAIKLVSNQFLSRIFVIPKKDDSHRPVAIFHDGEWRA